MLRRVNPCDSWLKKISHGFYEFHESGRGGLRVVRIGYAMLWRMPSKKCSVTVVYNQVGKDEYEELRKVDPASLDFTPEYPIHVATVQEEYKAILDALEAEGYHARAVNIRDDISRLQRVLRRNTPDAIFNLVELFLDDSRMESAVAAMFDLYRVPYTGSPPFALALCRRKGLTKQVLLQNGVATPLFKVLRVPKVPRRHGVRSEEHTSELQSP